MINSYRTIANGSLLVDRNGNVKSAEHTVLVKGRWGLEERCFKSRTLSQHRINSGYMAVSASVNGKVRNFLVHRLVAEAFPEICGEWFPGCQVNHKNEVKTDNRAENLETCTATYNANYGKGNRRRKGVIQLDLDGKFVSAYKSIADASLSLNGNKRSTGIVCCLAGSQKTAYGYRWVYDERDENNTTET